MKVEVAQFVTHGAIAAVDFLIESVVVDERTRRDVEG